MGKCKFWPSANQKHLNRSSPNLSGSLRRGRLPPKKFAHNPPKGFCSPHRWNIHPSCSKFTTFFGVWTRLQATPLDRFLRLIRQITRFCARKCFFIVIKNIFHLFIRQIRKNYNGAYQSINQSIAFISGSMAHRNTRQDKTDRYWQTTIKARTDNSYIWQ